ncbi:uncharacterized protein LOC123670495 [Melitaea cinxia]|uniref:uncharacterized protein LOC123670495 n=1 Tax=Melitaea cinxia TaxID=113334 RepID=UPI001E26FA6D|nr:uncharacterized protein LOC123670495 [Melitaea cinxia]
MNTPSQNIIINSCQYTPVYIIQNHAANQARPFFITQNSPAVEPPVTNNLKTFYENSGILETNLNSDENITQPTIPKKPEYNVVGNNLKLANFLKSENNNGVCPQKITTVNSVVVKPMYIANNQSSTMPKLDMNSRIVHLKDLPNVIRAQNGRILPKMKPKENLNILNNSQVKIVNQPIKVSSPQSTNATMTKPVYEPTTNKKLIYKVISPKEIKLLEQYKMNKQKKQLNTIVETVEPQKSEEVQEQKIQIETTVTRSGRIVKLPKTMIDEDSPNRPKRKNGHFVSCLQCSSKFSSSNRLQRHYEHHPSHSPSKLNTDLFECLLDVVNTESEENKSNVFLQQLKQFIKKLKSCVPCLLKACNTDGEPSIIDDEIGRLLGINPGKYNLNLEALNCEKDENGHCTHNPPPTTKQTHGYQTTDNTCVSELNEQTELRNIDDIKANTRASKTFHDYVKKFDNRKHASEWENQPDNGKKIKLSPQIESDRKVIDDIVAILSDAGKTEHRVETKTSLESKSLDNLVLENKVKIEHEEEILPKPTNTKPAHIEFRSTHFDIRSSPIKSTSTVFRKFQINPEKIAKYDVEQIRPIQLNTLAQEIEKCTENSPKDVVSNTNATPTDSIEQFSFKSPEEWHMPQTEDFSNNKCNVLISNQTENFLKTEPLIEPSLLHIKEESEIENVPGNNVIETSDITPNQNQSLISILEALGNELTFSEPAEPVNNNNSIDFQLDLFSYKD